jgi:hypothetical protein
MAQFENIRSWHMSNPTILIFDLRLNGMREAMMKQRNL